MTIFHLWQQGVISLVFSWEMKVGDGGSEIGTADPGLVPLASTIPDLLVPAALELVVVHSELTSFRFASPFALVAHPALAIGCALPFRPSRSRTISCISLSGHSLRPFLPRTRSRLQWL